MQPSSLFGAVSGNPSLIQSRFGTQGNFELLVPSASGGLIHFWRYNDNTFLPWSSPFSFGGSLGMADAVTMIESNFGSPGNLEVVCRAGNRLQFFWRDSGPAFNWNGLFQFESGSSVAGNPVSIQSRFSTQGNFELLVPSASGGLIHFWRNNDDPAIPWGAPVIFGGSLGMVDAVTMIESNFGSPGNLKHQIKSRLIHDRRTPPTQQNRRLYWVLSQLPLCSPQKRQISKAMKPARLAISRGEPETPFPESEFKISGCMTKPCGSQKTFV